ncbi:FMN-dependent NADH-azoreductase [Hyphomonas sp. WL0036]|uniref:FMN-dependent NADH-azoreductase n=1 Tax=Hyphomonas sediminis TaxID=2866160 RepID=UPI001C81E629|nr:FMN-dependent NADH-azoreductase [Hyphomonas sediminis]MBY9068307.1 FMN-dependent NADH-azoreductase [Hyphomonas sediminis]
MSNLLVINSSANTGASVSRVLIEEAVTQILKAAPNTTIVRRDLGSDPIPHLTTANLAGVRGTPSTSEELAARALSDKLIAELRAADTVVIAAPMYNFSVPTSLRAWFDFVLRTGETFRYTEAGPDGLLKGKKVIVLTSRGGLYSEGPGAAADFQEPYLRHLFAFVGITDISFIHAEKTGFGPDARDAAIASAKSQIAQAAQSLSTVAA